MRPLVVALLVLPVAFVAELAWAQGWHRMGGVPGMPTDVLRPPVGDPHHLRYHQSGVRPIFAFGQPGDADKATQTVEIDIQDEAGFSRRSFEGRAGETVRFVVRNLGKRTHELRIGDPSYQEAHAAMIKSMPDVEHDDPNAIIVAPGETGWIVWQFGNAPLVELTCHLDGHYAAGRHTVVVRIAE